MGCKEESFLPPQVIHLNERFAIVSNDLDKIPEKENKRKNFPITSRSSVAHKCVHFLFLFFFKFRGKFNRSDLGKNVLFLKVRSLKGLPLLQKLLFQGPEKEEKPQAAPLKTHQPQLLAFIAHFLILCVCTSSFLLVSCLPLEVKTKLHAS